MALKKQFLKSKPVCKVTFRLPSELVAEHAESAAEAFVVGEFNAWDPTANRMRKLKNGDFTANLDLESGKDYQYRFLLSGEVWVTDPEADRHEYSAFAECENAVVSCQA